jgi:ABC-type polysaccharide/polyol phosphate transport system ATPase subunit
MTAVRARGLGKGFRRYARPADRALEWLGGGVRHSLFWAVRGVSFELERGDTLGIVGDNGAGKTTLLAMLAGAATPTEGSLEVGGRIGSILELGAGLHGEFSGRENIFLAGQAQGLRREQIAAEVPGIIEFSELGEFIDLPARTYSSGMFLRLAFSVATAVHPDVLVIDEALAVGDQRFQAKCAERIDGFVGRGGTLIFCSHNLYQVKKLCRRVLWLEHGRVERLGAGADVCDAYADRSRNQVHSARLGLADGVSPLLQVVRVEATDGAGRRLAQVETGESVVLRVWLRRAAGSDVEPGIAVGVVRSDGLVCHCGSTDVDGVALRPIGDGEYFISLHLQELPLFGGSYHFNVAAIDNRRPLIMLDLKEGEAPFSVVNPKTDWGVSRLPHVWGHEGAEGEGAADGEVDRA